MKKILCMLGVLALIGGCSFSLTKGQNVVNLSQSDFSHKETLKRGESCEDYILGVLPMPFSSRTASLFESIDKAGISQVFVIDELYKYYFFYGTKCMVVYGR